MRIAFLQCDHVAPELLSIAGDYDEMYAKWLGVKRLECFRADHNDLPDCSHFDGFVISGSKYSVYDTEDWIISLQDLIKQIDLSHKKLVGICFGHQLIAEALGGKVAPNSEGWCVGLHTHFLLSSKTFMKPAAGHIKLPMSCRDQVIDLPPHAELLGGSHSCVNGFFQIEDHILAIQGHPEFPIAYLQALIERRETKIGSIKSRLALKSLNDHSDGHLVAKWVRSFMSI